MERGVSRGGSRAGARRGVIAACAALLVAGAVGCRPTLEGLPQHEQDRWRRCQRAVRANCLQNVAGGEPAFETRCLGSTRDQYAAQPSEASRRQYLIDRGCEPQDVR